jgi:hypothetical protein
VCFTGFVDADTFERLVAEQPSPPAGLTPALEALWHERRGNWARAHQIAQDDPGRDAAWVHAYLHRCEGDLPNAAYWYRRAGKPIVCDDLDKEWRAIVRALLGG